MIVLGIETSCDETAAAVVDGGRKVLSSVVASQDDVHAPYGGVVPELASRRHLDVLVPVVRRALETAGMALDDVDGLAVTYGPGLVGSLLVGCSAAKAIAYARRRPLVGVNHLEGHIYAAFLEGEPPSIRSSRWSSRAGTPRSTWPASRAATSASGRPATTRPARPSTRSPSCSAWASRAAPPSSGSRATAIPAPSRSRPPT